MAFDASKLDGPTRATILDTPCEGQEVVSLEFMIGVMPMRAI